MRDEPREPIGDTTPPDWNRAVRERLSAFRLEPTLEHDIADELAQHFQDRYEHLLICGIPDSAARDQVHREISELQNVSLEEWRPAGEAVSHQPLGAPSRAKGSIIADGLLQDIRYAGRRLIHAPAFTIAAVVSLALGIGATTAAFSILHTLLLERLALPNAEQLAVIRPSAALPDDAPRAAAEDGHPVPVLNYDTYAAFKALHLSPAVEGFTSRPLVVVNNGVPDYDVSVDLVTGGWFDLLGVQPIRGRGITPEDENTRAQVAVLSAGYWRAMFNDDSTIIGRTIDIGAAKVTVVGIMPASFRGLYFGRPFKLAVPVTIANTVLGVDVRSLAPLGLVTRLEPRGSPVATKAKVEAALAGIGTPHAVTIEDASRGLRWSSDLRGRYKTLSIVLLCGVGLLLLIACANVATLLIGRALAREREFAIRLALGASGVRLGRQLFVESLELSALGTVLAIGLARAATIVIARRLPTDANVLADLVPLRPSMMLMLVATGIMILVTLLIGVMPALLAARSELRASLSGRVHRLFPKWSADNALVAAQIALGLVLVSAASLFVTTLRQLTEFQGGYRTTHVILADVDLRQTRYETESAATLERILGTVKTMPGVAAAGFGSAAPLLAYGRMMRPLDMRAGKPLISEMIAVSPGYFAATRIGLIAGRDFSAADQSPESPSIILSAALARQYGSPESVIGRIFYRGTNSPFRVIGVAGDAHQPPLGADRRDDVRGDSTLCFYVPLVTQKRLFRPILVVQTTNDPSAIVASVQRAISAATPGIRIGQVRTVNQALDDLLPRERLAAALSLMLGALALVLAAVGVSGVVAYFVTQRTTEIGVRMALGARPVDASLFVLRHMLVVAGFGIAVGIPLSIAAGRLIAAQLFGISPTDPRVLAGAALVFIVAATAAAILPARRASRVDPMVAIRAE